MARQGLEYPMADIAARNPAGHPTQQRSSLHKLMQRKSTIAFLMALPLILLITILVAYPAGYAVYLATLNKGMTRFVGFGNFEFLFGRDTFWLVVYQSCLFAITAVIFKAIIGFVVAHFVHNIPSKGQRKWRGMLLVPWVIPPAMSTLAWLWLVRWRAGRNREALWRSLVLPASGVALGWLLLMTLGLPVLDYARSDRPLIEKLGQHLPREECVLARNLPRHQIAGLAALGGYRVFDEQAPQAPACDFLLTLGRRARETPQGWEFVARERRPTDRSEFTYVYRRAAATR